MGTPLVSVIIPAYNGGAFIAQTIDSVLRQSYPHREIFVVDDGSSDDTPQVVEKYHPSVHYIRQENSGAGAARNRGLERASGDYIALLDHDDVWLPETLEVQLAVAARRPESGLIACDGVYFDDDRILSNTLFGGPLSTQLATAPGGEITGWFYRELLSRDYAICCPAQTLIPRHVTEHIGPIVANRNEPPDLEYYLRIALQYPVTLHRESLVRYRYVPTGMSGLPERRRFVYALMEIYMLKRHLQLSAPERRPLVSSRLRTVVRGSAAAAYHYGRHSDMAFARSYLSKVRRVAPGEQWVKFFLVASWLPSWVDGSFRRLRRIARRQLSFTRTRAISSNGR